MTSCIYKPTIPVTISWSPSNLTSKELTVARAAFDEWNKHLGKTLFVETTPDNHPTWVIGRIHGDRVIRWHLLSAETNPNTKVINIYNAWAQRSEIGQLNIIKHEIGYILGYPHDDRPNCLMSDIENNENTKEWCF
jgi:hypothetical protein